MLKRFLPRGLLGRTMLIIILPMVILQAISLYMFYDRHWIKLAQRLSSSVAGDVGLVVEWYEADPRWLDAAQRVRLKRYIDLDATPVQPTGASESASYDHFTRALEHVLDDRAFRLTNPGGRNLTAIVETAQGPLAIEVPKRRLYSSTTKIFTLWMIGSTLLITIVAAIFLRRQIKPILRLSRAAWGQGRIADSGMKLEGADEVRQAIAAFLDMQERLNRQQEQRQAIMTGVREDIQKPIDRIKLTLNGVLAGHPDAPAIAADLRDMERMIDGYLAYMHSNRDEPLQMVALKSLLDEAMRLSGVKNLTLDRHGVETIMIKARPLAITRAFANIIRTAKTLDAHRVTVEARMIATDDGSVLLLVFEDDGRGLSENERELALRPLADSGMGGRDYALAIAADMVMAQNGTLELTMGVKGLRVSIVLPA